MNQYKSENHKSWSYRFQNIGQKANNDALLILNQLKFNVYYFLKVVIFFQIIMLSLSENSYAGVILAPIRFEELRSGCHGGCASCIASQNKLQCISPENAIKSIHIYPAYKSAWAHKKDLQCSVSMGCYYCPEGWFFSKRRLTLSDHAGPAGWGPVCLSPDEMRNKQDRACPTIGNPILIATGNKFQTEVDYQSTKQSSLKFSRYYNSDSFIIPTNMGQKWNHTYSQHLTSYKKSTSIHRNNGQVFIYNYNDTTWQSDPDISETLTETFDSHGNHSGWLYTTSNSTEETYNTTGQLTQITSRAGQTQTLEYDIAVIDGGDDNSSTLDKISNYTGETILLTYNLKSIYPMGITSMTDVEGHLYSYKYAANGNLTSVIYPDNTLDDSTDNPTRIYHYEDVNYPHHLTGITDETGIRYVTWHYDSQGRAISSELADGVDKSTLTFNTDDSVTTTNPLGKKTTYHFAMLYGVKKVTKVEGHATENCAGANKNYTYDANGFLASKTDWQGKTTDYIHNERGLEISRTEAAGTAEARTITTEWHANYRLPITIVDSRKTTNYSYDAQGRLLSQTTRLNQP